MSTVEPAGAASSSLGQGMAPTVPRLPSASDRVLPIFIVVSVIVHATIFLPSFLRGTPDKAVPPVPKEIPVDIVQMPPPPKPPPPKPQQVAKREAPKPPVQKPPPPKPQPKTESVADRLQNLLGPMPAVALPGAASSGSDEVSYAQLVLSKLAKAKKDGRFQHPPGATGIAFTLGDAGEVVKVEIRRPSGDKWLDDEAIEMVKRGAPYPPPPPGAQRDFAITLRLQSLI